MICPHCLKDTNILSQQQIDEVHSSCRGMEERTIEIIKAVIPKIPTLNAKNYNTFLANLLYYPEEDIYFSIDYFLKKEYHLQGKTWEYLVAIIKRRSEQRRIQIKNKLPILPPSYVNDTPESDR